MPRGLGNVRKDGLRGPRDLDLGRRADHTRLHGTRNPLGNPLRAFGGTRVDLARYFARELLKTLGDILDVGGHLAPDDRSRRLGAEPTVRRAHDPLST